MMALERKTFKLADVEVPVWIFIDVNKNVWFKAREISNFLGYKFPIHAIRDNVTEINKTYWEKLSWVSTVPLEIPKNWQKNTIFINESGLYQLLLKSKLPDAEKFQLWVTNEILPSIRKTGAYISQNISSTQISDLISSLKEKDLQINTKDLQINTLISQMGELVTNNNLVLKKLINVKPKVAVIPENIKEKHSLQILKHKTLKNKYKFIRIQNKNLKKALKKVDNDYVVQFVKEDIPNGVNVLNVIKEQLNKNKKKYKSKNNEIITTNDIISITKDIIENILA